VRISQGGSELGFNALPRSLTPLLGPRRCAPIRVGDCEHARRVRQVALCRTRPERSRRPVRCRLCPPLGTDCFYSTHRAANNLRMLGGRPAASAEPGFAGSVIRQQGNRADASQRRPGTERWSRPTPQPMRRAARTLKMRIRSNPTTQLIHAANNARCGAQAAFDERITAARAASDYAVPNGDAGLWAGARGRSR